MTSTRASAPEQSWRRRRLAVGVATTLIFLAALAVRGQAVLGLVVLACIMVPLERAFALRPQPILRRGWRTDTVHFVVNNVLTLAGVAVVVVPLMAALRALSAGHHVAGAVASQPWSLQLAEALIVAELSGYWSHRASHRVPWLWRFHAVHHSIEELDWLAAGRLHPLDQVFRQTCVFLPLYALGFSRATFGGVIVFFAFQAVFVHANLRWRFGPLRWVIATPAFHHWHHARDPAAYNTNFAGELPLIDALFGTLHLPGREWPETYGADVGLPDGYLAQLALPFSAGRR